MFFRALKKIPGNAAVFARLISVFALVFSANAASPLAAYTPESPQVQGAIKRGVTFLSNEGSGDPRPGAQALLGIALIKNGVPSDHPKVQGAVLAVKKQIPKNDPRQASIENIYSVGLSIIFLVSLDPEKYREEINCLLNFLYYNQKPHGGWGYYAEDLGDTSMTQYGVLSSWEAKQAGFAIPMNKMEGVADWLMRTQDPSGGFAYKGRVAPEGTLVPQDPDKIRQSMSAAGGGCLFILADLFQFDLVPKKKEELPSALKEAKVKEKDTKSSNRPTTRINAKQLRETQVRVNEWMKKNYTINPPFGYRYYYFYALERFMSFRDLIEQTSEKEPKWYNEGIEYIMQHQKDDGSCTEEGSECGPVVDTAFAILFMNRATKKAIEKAKNYGAGMLVGGRGLGSEKDSFEMRNGQVVAKPLMGPAEDLLKMLDDPKLADYDQVLEMMAELPSQQLETLLAAHGDKLRQLASGKDPDARMAAVMALGKTRSLDNVPALIYALSKDEDREVVIEARRALERISRNPAGYGPQDDYNEEQRRTAVEKWKSWYLSLRPDAEVDF